MFHQTHEKLIHDYVGTVVLWHDQYGNAVGPATVVAVTQQNKLKILDHEMMVYLEVWPIINSVKVIEFSDSQYEALPELLRTEILIATSDGSRCGYEPLCGQARLFGSEYCEQHTVMVEWPEHDPREDIWADNDGLVGADETW